MENKRWKIEIGHETFYQIATNQHTAIHNFFMENTRYLDCKYKISEADGDGVPVKDHIILDRLDKIVEEIYEIKKMLWVVKPVEINKAPDMKLGRTPDDGC